MTTSFVQNCCGNYVVTTTATTFVVGTTYLADDGTYWTAISGTPTSYRTVTLTFTSVIGTCADYSASCECDKFIIGGASTSFPHLYDYIDCNGDVHYNVDALVTNTVCGLVVFAGTKYGTPLTVTNNGCCNVVVSACCSPHNTEVMTYGGGFGSCVMDTNGVCYKPISGTCDPATVVWIGYQAPVICEQCLNQLPPCPTCQYPGLCLNTGGILPYDGSYFFMGTYNGYDYYSGGTTPAFIFWDLTKWCLSDTLGGACILYGNLNCNTVCPDLGNVLSYTPCQTPAVTNPCDIFTFDSFFDCNLVSQTPTPSVTPTPTITPSTTPTPTPSQICNVGIEVSATTLPTPTPSVTPSVTPSLPAFTCDTGTVTFNLFDERFVCITTKELVNCETNEIYYVTEPIEFNSTLYPTGTTISAIINGIGVCAIYTAISTKSPNAILSVITDVTSDCDTCIFVTPTPTPSITPTKTPTPTPTPSITPTITPSVTPTITPTPSITPTITPSVTATVTPTPSITPTITPSSSLPVNQCLVVYSELGCGYSYLDPIGNINGRLAFSGYSVYMGYPIIVYWDGTDRWVLENQDTNEHCSEMLLDLPYPVGTSVDWVSATIPPNPECACLSQDTFISTYLGACDSTLFTYNFELCCNTSEVVKITDIPSLLNIGDVYYVDAVGFSGCATVVDVSGSTTYPVNILTPYSDCLDCISTNPCDCYCYTATTNLSYPVSVFITNCDGSYTSSYVTSASTDVYCAKQILSDGAIITQGNICNSGTSECLMGCVCYTVTISNQDIGLALGNTNSSNDSKVFIKYYDCDTDQYITTGITTPQTIYICTSHFSGKWYYQNNLVNEAANSTATTLSVPCSTSSQCSP